MKTLGFWSHFEEIVLEESLESSEAYGTQTRQREEPDQRNACLLAGSKTITETREESDQDYGNEEYCAIPKQDSDWKTFTKTREEPDQDKSSRRYATIPTEFLLGTKTFTDEREEADQDETNRVYGALPVDSRVLA